MKSVEGVDLVSVFTFEGRGGNPCPIVVDGQRLGSSAMQAIAQHHGHESGFVLPATSKEYDFSFRFWVPNHEMEMCGHATIGALWLLASKNVLPSDVVRVETRSGPVTGFVRRDADAGASVEITQPAGKVTALSASQTEDVMAVMGLSRDDMLDLPIQNAVTSRVKTIVPIKDVGRLNALKSNMQAVEALCNRIGSTGLYPYAINDSRTQSFDARQFPRSSGYPEDAATGIAAAALSFGLLANGLVDRSDAPIRIFQGRAMGSLSEIGVRLGFAGGRAIGCLLGGAVQQMEMETR
jgi:PhzF family phenazine biosynthesis protein